MSDGARLPREQILDTICGACSDRGVKITDASAILDAIKALPVDDYGPVTTTVRRDEMIEVAAGLNWLRGYLHAKGDEIPDTTLRAFDTIDRLAGYFR